MFYFIVPDETVGICRNAFAQGLNMGQRGKGDGNERDQLWGLVGEIAVKNKIFGIGHSFGGGYDGGYDLEYCGVKVDIKTKPCNSTVQSNYEHNIFGFQKDYDLDGYIFVRINEKHLLLTVCGVCHKADFFKMARLDKKDTLKVPDNGVPFKINSDLYSVYYDQMQDVKNVSEVKEFICEWRLKRLTKS